METYYIQVSYETNLSTNGPNHQWCIVTSVVRNKSAKENFDIVHLKVEKKGHPTTTTTFKRSSQWKYTITKCSTYLKCDLLKTGCAHTKSIKNIRGTWSSTKNKSTYLIQVSFKKFRINKILYNHSSSRKCLQTTLTIFGISH